MFRAAWCWALAQGRQPNICSMAWPRVWATVVSTTSSGVPTSSQAEALARELGIPLATLEQHPQLDLALDGADEVDPALNLIKGLGGALLYEKIVESSTKRLIIMADKSKLVEQLAPTRRCPSRLSRLGCRSLPAVWPRWAASRCCAALPTGSPTTPTRAI